MATAYAATAGDSTEVGITFPSRTITAYCEFVQTAAFVINDTVLGPALPKDAVLLDAWLSTDDLDTHATPLITLTLRATDGTTPKNAFAASTIGQTGGVKGADTYGFMGYVIPNHNYYLELLVPAAPATGTTDKELQMFVSYTMDKPFGYTGAS